MVAGVSIFVATKLFIGEDPGGYTEAAGQFVFPFVDERFVTLSLFHGPDDNGAAPFSGGDRFGYVINASAEALSPTDLGRLDGAALTHPDTALARAGDSHIYTFTAAAGVSPEVRLDVSPGGTDSWPVVIPLDTRNGDALYPRILCSRGPSYVPASANYRGTPVTEYLFVVRDCWAAFGYQYRLEVRSQ